MGVLLSISCFGLGMYFFKVWMMKRMDNHIAYMSEKEKKKIESIFMK